MQISGASPNIATPQRKSEFKMAVVKTGSTSGDISTSGLAAAILDV